MKKPEIVYCNVIRKDDKQGEVAIKARAIEGMMDALIDARDALKNTKQDYSKRQLRSYKVNNSLDKVDNALEKAGVEL